MPRYQKNPKIRFIKNPEFNNLTLGSKEDFLNSNYVILSNSNRMAYILSGALLSYSNKKEMLSSAVNFGTIQLLPNGLPIILMADHQTTGGYPKIGNVIKYDLPLLAQLVSGDTIQFEGVTLEHAKKLLIQEEKYYHSLKENLKFIYEHN